MSTKIGIIICDRYRDCAGENCFRALKNREGAFSIYADHDVEVVGYTSCGGCPGGNVEYTSEGYVCRETVKKTPPFFSHRHEFLTEHKKQAP